MNTLLLLLTFTTPNHHASNEILFNSDRAGSSHLFIMDASGEILRQVTQGESSHWNARWSPDGKRIWFLSDKDGGERIYHMSAAGGDATPTPITKVAGFALSPNGQKITFYREGPGWSDIFVADTDGSNEVNLTEDHEGRDLKPAWSPDGQKITFTSNRDGNLEVYIMNADGSGAINISNNPADDGSSNFSPDGKHLLFRSGRMGNQNQEIFIMEADGKNVRRVTNHPKWELVSSWSFDGKWITFGSNRDGNWEIYKTALPKLDSNTHPIRLTNAPGFDGDPVWRPSK